MTTHADHDQSPYDDDETAAQVDNVLMIRENQYRMNDG